MSDTYILITVAIIALITAALRFLPFLIFSGGKKTPGWVSYLGKVLPYAIMGMLVIYCLKNINFTNISTWVPEAISVGVVVGLHIWKRNTLLSIVCGTVCYMLLVQFVF